MIGGEAYAASHRLKMPRTATTVLITPKYLIKVQSRGDTGELVFENPVIVKKHGRASDASGDVGTAGIQLVISYTVEIVGLEKALSGLASLESSFTRLSPLMESFGKEFYAQETSLFDKAPWTPLALPTQSENGEPLAIKASCASRMFFTFR